MLFKNNSYELRQGFQQVPGVSASIYKNDPDIQVNLSVYPNPCKDFTYIEIEGPHDNYELSVCEINGKMIHSGILRDRLRNKLDIQTWHPGVYFLQITDNKEVIARNKLIITQ